MYLSTFCAKQPVFEAEWHRPVRYASINICTAKVGYDCKKEFSHILWCVKNNNPDRSFRELLGDVNPVSSLSACNDIPIRFDGLLFVSSTHAASKLVRSMQGENHLRVL